ncbi:kinase-like domain-containing protein [Mycena polygramma]|nr:kinase-like domain-containing protein [Mycena polygramma]
MLADIWHSATGVFSAVNHRPAVPVPGASSSAACRFDRRVFSQFAAPRLWTCTNPSRLAPKAPLVSPILAHEGDVPGSDTPNIPPPHSDIVDAPPESSASQGSQRDASSHHIVEGHGTEYEISGLMGEGATAKVMLASASYPGAQEQCLVAVKMFNILSKLKGIQRRQGSPAASKRKLPSARSVNAEVRILRRLSESPNNRGFFTPLLAAFHDEENVYLVMRMYPETLWDRLDFLSRQGLRLTVETIRLYAAELIFAVESLHTEHRILHCDLKPRNILISPSGHLCLADFGLSIHCYDGPEMYSFMVPKTGTPYYWPPECYNANVTHVNGVGLDTYALGRIIHELFVGAAEMTNVIPANRPPLSLLKHHDFFSGMFVFFSSFLRYFFTNASGSDWRKVEARGYCPRYRPGPNPKLNPNPSSALPSSINSLDLEHLALGVEHFISQLDVNFSCSETVRFDPLHDGSQGSLGYNQYTF